MGGEQRFVELCLFVRSYLEESAAGTDQAWVKSFPRAAGHRWRHTLNVLRNAEEILKGEGADEETATVIRVAAVLHDVSMFVCDHRVHGKVSAEIAEAHLREQGYAEGFTRRVGLAIAEHGTDLGPLPPEEQGRLLSFEGKVLIEADILDKLGASAVTSALLGLGKEAKLPHECRAAMAQGVAVERATLFKDYVWTATGRALADERYRFFLAYLEQLAEEVDDGEDPCDPA